MRLKTYFVDGVEEALLRARAEFGEDAMLVHSKRTTVETAHLGNYEVVFATPQAANTPPAPETLPTELKPVDVVRRPPVRSETATLEKFDRASSDANQARIRRELMALSKMMDAPPLEELCRSEEIRRRLDELYGYLAEREVRSKHIEEITKRIGIQLVRGSIQPGQTLETILEKALVDPLASVPPSAVEKRRVIALIGPPGAGKTTTLAKLAVREGLACGRPVHVLDLDNQRIGGGDHLQTICGLLGVSYQQVLRPELVPEILSEIRSDGLILIDTPGLTVDDSSELAVMGLGLGGYLTMERHLVLPATLRNPEMSRYWSAYRVCQPTHLLFSRLDESLCFGPVWSLAVETELPIAWMTTGRKIPECIVEATPRLVSSLVNQGFHAVRDKELSRPTPKKARSAEAPAYPGIQDTARSFATL